MNFSVDKFICDDNFGEDNSKVLRVSTENGFNCLCLYLRIIRENSRYESGPPVRLIKELERGTLVLSDLEISDEDIPVLCRFFNTKQVRKN